MNNVGPQNVEDLGNIFTGFRTDLNEGDFKFVGEGFTF